MSRIKAFKCDLCGSLTEDSDGTLCRHRMLGKVTAEYTERLCPTCAGAAVEGKKTRGVRQRGGPGGDRVTLMLPDQPPQVVHRGGHDGS